ncbi:hypothetical protein P838_04374 [Enterobacter hormaechei]|uniref:hypothetical protein n=1 Tax=Enterobacter hormaechei TaxID=158836 RepID=UPI00044F0A56|nr:hypothetical protein [Enterobacter hormaechei]EUL63039.1 hypothetical protein P838_04374 [Enterobacter hormaechei]EUL63621.1 hypothetical protein P839_04034 [Enterobacter hormaechei]
MLFLNKEKRVISAVISTYLELINVETDSFKCGDGDWLSNTTSHKYISIKKIQSDSFTHSLTISKPITDDAMSSITFPVRIIDAEYGAYIHTSKNRFYAGDKKSIAAMLESISNLI